jgi:cyclopropane-fatty-acyl-phospholipid synthase
MQKSEMLMRDLLALADVQINGSRQWDIQVHDSRFHERVLRDSSLGLGEAYMDGWWDCDAIDEMITRVLIARLDEKIKQSMQIAFQVLKARFFNRQSSARAYEVGEHHYDLGNDLYCAMLDKRLNYTCGYWKTAKTLDDAQEAKLELVCKKIGIKPGMKILELGCGWGSFAKYAAEKYGHPCWALPFQKSRLRWGWNYAKDCRSSCGCRTIVKWKENSTRSSPLVSWNMSVRKTTVPICRWSIEP